MKIVFFEVEQWEIDKLKSAFPEALLVGDKLDQETVKNEAYKDAEVISVFVHSSVTKEVIDGLPKLKLIATRSTGFDHIDIEYCKSKNIHVVNVPEYGSNTVAEHTFALILSLTRKIYESVNYSKHLNFEHESITGTDLYGKTIGIIGLGKIGVNVLRIAKGFGMEALVNNRSHDEELIQAYHFKYVDLPTLLQNSDIVTIHLPLNKETEHIINKDNINQFKKGSYLINTARGGLIETEAVILGLSQGILEGVGLDVLEEENALTEEAAMLTTEFKQNTNLRNLIYDHILVNHPKVIITPHNAFNSKEALARITNTTIDNIKSFMDGKLENTV